VKKLLPYAVLVLLLAAGFSLATALQGRVENWRLLQAHPDDLLNVVLGDWRRMFANQFFVQADVSFHGGYYPSIFDQARPATHDTRHLTAKEGEAAAEEHEKRMQFLGPPRDWIERFGRHFLITEHTHLQGLNEREILPWLKVASELDPHKIDSYAVAAYWLRSLGKFDEAERFLREGLLNNPGNYDLLCDLGTLRYKNKHDPAHARKLWEFALRQWARAQAAGEKPDVLKLDTIAVSLARLEQAQGDYARALEMFELAKKASPNPEALEQQIQGLKRKLAAARQGTKGLKD
jgi:tetratricopeptide (TPR) repeat protein